MWVHHRHATSLIQGVLQLVQQVGPHDLVVELRQPAYIVEGETPHLAADFAILGDIYVFIRTRRGEVDDMIAIIQLVRHLTEVVPERDLQLTGLKTVDA